MSTIQNSDQKAKIVGRHLSLALPTSPLVKQEEDRAQEAIWRLQDEVKRLQHELAQTRRALEQRAILLRNPQQRETKGRAEEGVW